MLSIIAAVGLAIHGAIHLIGFVVPWQLATVDGFPYRTTLLGGALEVGAVGARALGVVWLILAAGFVVAGLAIWRGEPWAIGLTMALAVASIVVCILGLPEAVTGIAADIAILVAAIYLVVAGQAAGFAGR